MNDKKNIHTIGSNHTYKESNAEGMRLQSIVDKTCDRVKEITNGELKYIFKHINDNEIDVINQAIKSGNEERIKASINIPIYRIMQEIVLDKRPEVII